MNPSDSTSLGRIVNVPPRGIGDTSIGRLENFATAQGLTLYEAFQKQDQIPALTSAAALPKALLRKRGGSGTWISPDRGIR